MSVRLSKDDNKSTLIIDGRFDFEAHTTFRKCSEQALDCAKTTSIVVDLSRVTYLDSSALGMLLLLREKAATGARKRIVLHGAKGLVQQVLQVANFHTLFHVD